MILVVIPALKWLNITNSTLPTFIGVAEPVLQSLFILDLNILVRVIVAKDGTWSYTLTLRRSRMANTI